MGPVRPQYFILHQFKYQLNDGMGWADSWVAKNNNNDTTGVQNRTEVIGYFTSEQ